MPNHYTNVIIAAPVSARSYDRRRAILKAWAKGLHQRLVPVDTESGTPQQSLDRQWRAWGHKWEEYDITTPRRLPGDCGAFEVCFCTAWEPPNANVVELACADLKARGMEVLSWVGLDPYDNTATMLYAKSKEVAHG